MSRTKRLAAIMFTDIVGYTAMMQTDEEQAVRALYRHREAIEGLVPAYDGDVEQFYGDGSLSLFSSTNDAVACARSIQIALRKGEVVPLRIGIHIGEVSKEGGKVFGDGVNVASRIESSGHTGTVLLSKGAYDKVRNRKDLQFRSMGMFSFKNVTEPMEVFGLVDDRLPLPDPQKLSNRLEKPPRWLARKSNRLVAALFLLVALATAIAVSVLRKEPASIAPEDKAVVAVFPFRVEGNDNLDYLKEGMVDLFSTKLEGIPDLQALDPNIVIANTRKSPVDRLSPQELSALARSWGANQFITGSLIQVGGDIRIRISEYRDGEAPVSTAEVLLDSEEELMAGIDRLAQQSIANELDQEGQELAALSTMTSSSLNAVKFFLNGENLRRSGNYSAAIEEYSAATVADSTMAMAWLRMTQACAWTGDCNLPRSLLLPRVLAHKDKLPGKLREYAGAMAGFYTDAFKTSEGAFRELIRKYGEEVDFLVGLGEALFHANQYRGRLSSEAKPYFIKALEYDPDNIEIRQHLYQIFANDGDTTALNNLLAATPYESDYWFAFRSLVLVMAGNWTETDLLQVLEHPQFDWTRLYNMCHIQTRIPVVIRLFSDLMSLPNGEAIITANRPPVPAIMRFWQGQDEEAWRILSNSPGRQFLPYIFTLCNMEPELDIMSGYVEPTIRNLQSGRFNGFLPDDLILALHALQGGDISTYNRHVSAIEELAIDARSGEWLRRYCDALYLRLTNQHEKSNSLIDTLLLASIKEFQFTGASSFLDGALMLARAENSHDLGDYAISLKQYEAMFDSMNAGDELVLGYSLLRRGEIAEAAGLANRAIQYYSRFLALYENCDPKYDEWKDVARANRQRLVGEVN